MTLAGLLIGPGSAGASVLPASVTVTNEPASISWPGSPHFEAKLRATSGPEGADFNFRPDPIPWGIEGVGGVAMTDGRATLDGPGELRTSMVVAGPVGPGGCSRGFGYSTEFSYSLKLPPDSETTVRIPYWLNAAPLAGMNSTVRITYFADTPLDQTTLEAPVQVGGLHGVVIRFGVEGQKGQLATIPGGKSFRLRGTTDPPLPDTTIRVKASPFLYPTDSPPRPRWVEVKTGSDGAFRTKPLSFGVEASWRLTARPVHAPAYDDEPSCGPVLETKKKFRIAYEADLIGGAFRSETVKGIRGLGNRGVTLRFDRVAEGLDPDDGIKPHWASTFRARGGCDAFDGYFSLKAGRLVGRKISTRTPPPCERSGSRVLRRALRRGLDARITEGKLVLTRKREMKIQLRETGH